MSKKQQSYLSFQVNIQPLQAILALATFVGAGYKPAPTIAQILPDNTLPSNSIVTPDGNRSPLKQVCCLSEKEVLLVVAQPIVLLGNWQ